MNPIINALKALSITTVNIIIALIFFIITAKITNPSFFGEVAIIQLLEVVSVTFFAFLNQPIITREITYMYAKREIDKKFVSTALLTPIIVSPIFFVLLIFPNYVKLSIPYLILYLYESYANSIVVGLNKYTESSISGIIFLMIRWGLSIIAVLKEDIYLFVVIWIIGGSVTSTFLTLVIHRAINGLILSFSYEIFKRIFKEGIYLYLSGITSFLSSQGDRVTTSYLLGSYYLGLYQFAALVASVPGMIIGGITYPLLTSASYYKALGKDELTISRLSFKVTAFLSYILVILSIPLAYIIIPKLFPLYQESIRVLIILLLVTTLPQPIGIFPTFLIAFRKSLRPFLVLSFVNAFTVLTTSYFLIPRIGIMGGAISQLIVSIISSSFILYYTLSSKVFHLSWREVGILLFIPAIFIYELFIDPQFLDILLLVAVILFFKIGRIFSEQDKNIIVSFLPSKISFIKWIIKILL